MSEKGTYQCCGQQSSETIKLGENACFTCLGCSSSHILQMGHYYPTCSPLVQGPTKHDPLRPMTDPTECIVAFVGPCCDIDATCWEEDCSAHVYCESTAIKECINWPVDEEGNCLFTIEDIELIAHAHCCCIDFDCLIECAKAPAWLSEQNQPVKAKAA